MTRRGLMGFIGFFLAAFMMPVRWARAHHDTKSEDQIFRELSFGLLAPRLLQALNLTAAQKAEVEARKKVLLAKHKVFTKETSALRIGISNKLFALGAEVTDVVPSIRQMAELKEKLLQEGFESSLELQFSLRPDQLLKAQKIRQELLALKQHEQVTLGEK